MYLSYIITHFAFNARLYAVFHYSSSRAGSIDPAETHTNRLLSEALILSTNPVLRFLSLMILTDKSERVKNLIFSIMKLLILPTADPKRVSNVPSSTVDLKQLCLQILSITFSSASAA